MGALALTSKKYYRIPFEPVMPGVTFLEYGNIEEAKKAIKSGKTSTVFKEPIQGEGGIYSATKEFLQSLHAALVLLVFDEDVASADSQKETQKNVASITGKHNFVELMRDAAVKTWVARTYEGR